MFRDILLGLRKRFHLQAMIWFACALAASAQGPHVPHRFLAEMQQADSAPSTAQATAQPSAATATAPFDFSHKRHGTMKMDCSFCHQQAVTGTRAGFPAVSQCMQCHLQIAKDTDAIKKLAALSPDTHLVPTKPLYKLPDFVFFSHARHKAGNVECAACHGNVWEQEVVELKLPMRMKACVDCHKTNSAPVTCNTCHEPFQQ